MLKFLGRAGPDIGGKIRLDPTKPAEAKEFVSAELVGLGLFTPASEAARATRSRTDSIAPVVFVGEAASWPPHYHRTELADMFDQGGSNAVNVRNLRVRSDPNSVVDDTADVFSKLAVKSRTDRRDWLVEQYGDGELRRSRTASPHHPREGCDGRTRTGNGHPLDGRASIDGRRLSEWTCR